MLKWEKNNKLSTYKSSSFAFLSSDKAKELEAIAP